VAESSLLFKQIKHMLLEGRQLLAQVELHSLPNDYISAAMAARGQEHGQERVDTCKL
jgi:hypothetical protein